MTGPSTPPPPSASPPSSMVPTAPAAVPLAPAAPRGPTAAPGVAAVGPGRVPGRSPVATLATLGTVAVALLAALVAAAAPRGVLVVVLLPVQLLLAAGWLALAAVPSRAAGVVIATAAGLAADLLLALRARPGLGALAGVIGLGVVAAVLGQLVRPERSRVTDVLAAHCSAVLLAVAVSPPLALAALPRGGRDDAAALVALALTVAAAELGALLAPRHRILGAAGLGLLLGAGGGVVIGEQLARHSGPVVALTAAAATVVARLVVAVVADRTAALLGALLPFALIAPGLYVVGRVMSG